MEGSVMRKRADALGDVGFTEPAEEERDMIETIADTGPAWKETEAPPEEKRRRLLAIPHWDRSYGGIPERWR
jgi:hypothetical protein